VCGAVRRQKKYENPHAIGAGRKRYYRGEARQRFHINDRVDADFPDPERRSQRTGGKSEKVLRRDRYHISIGNDFYHVENEAIIFEYDEVNVFTSNHFDRAQNCRIGENG
jgi:hypothetical protein